MEEVVLVSIPINKKIFDKYCELNSKLGFFEKEIPERIKGLIEKEIINENSVFDRVFYSE